MTIEGVEVWGVENDNCVVFIVVTQDFLTVHLILEGQLTVGILEQVR